jgi:hydroxylamine reductase
MQDTLSHAVKSVSLWANSAREAGATEEQLHAANVWTLRAVFSTLTNVNFSEERIAEYIQEGMVIKKDLEKLSTSSKPVGPVAETPLLGKSLQELEEFGHSVSIPKRLSAMGDEDCFSLNEIATYGARGTFDMVPSMGCDYWQDFANDAYRIRNNLMTRKRGTSGACAYAAHCYQMGKMDHSIMEDLHKVFCKLASDEPDMEGLLANVLKVGEINGRVLAMLDDAHATTFGAPEPTPVKMTATEGKAILVSGHDMVDLEALLQQTEGKGVNVYTHGEMLPAHSYPGLKKYKHLVGNYGTAWQNQKFEFATFPGPIIVTTNCVQAPRSSYRDRLYTMNEVGVDGVGHIGEDRDFSKVIEQAKSMKGFKATIEPTVYHTVGFNHRAVLPLAKQVIDAAQSGALSRIVLIGGCDGSQHDRK